MLTASNSIGVQSTYYVASEFRLCVGRINVTGTAMRIKSASRLGREDEASQLAFRFAASPPIINRDRVNAAWPSSRDTVEHEGKKWKRDGAPYKGWSEKIRSGGRST